MHLLIYYFTGVFICNVFHHSLFKNRCAVVALSRLFRCPLCPNRSGSFYTLFRALDALKPQRVPSVLLYGSVGWLIACLHSFETHRVKPCSEVCSRTWADFGMHSICHFQIALHISGKIIFQNRPIAFEAELQSAGGLHHCTNGRLHKLARPGGMCETMWPF